MNARRTLAVPLLGGLAVAAIVFAAMSVGGDDTAAPPQRAAPSPTGRAVFARMGCGSCHRLAAAGAQGEIGPDLDERLASHTRASLIRQIVDPSAGGTSPSSMPSGFGDRMRPAELDALVTFLLAARRP